MRRLLLVALAVGLFPASAHAAVFNVTKQADTNDHACTATKCSLRDAVIASNAVAGPNVINLKSGHYKLTIAGRNEDAAATGDLDVQKSVTIKGAGVASTTIDANKIDRAFEVTGSANLAVSGVTVTRGAAVPQVAGASAHGGAVYDHGGGSLTFTNAAITHNTAASGSGDSFGGAISTTGSVALTNTTISGNQAGGSNGTDFGFGGAIDVEGAGNVTLTRVTATGNHAGGNGPRGAGGVVYSLGPSISIASSTLSGNTAGGDGGSGFGGVLDVEAATITGTTIRSNHAGGNGGTGFGGALGLSANSTLTNSVVADNTVGGAGTDAAASATGRGGGIYDGQTVTLTNTTVSGNTAGGGNSTSEGVGGGIDASVTAVDSTIADNTVGGGGSAGFGGGIFASGPANLTNSTVTGNHATGGSEGNAIGGGISADPVTLTYSDVVGNVAAGSTGSSGGGLDSGSITSLGSIVADNTASTGANCDIAATSQGHNLENGLSCGFTGPGDLNAEPHLGPLANNGGLTPTRQLLAGSPAINGGDTSGCPATDQRGVTRPQSGVCDIGSYEVASPTAVTGGSTIGHSQHAFLRGIASNPDAVSGTGYFQFGKAMAYGSASKSVSLAAGALGKGLKVSVGKLKPGTLYHYRLVVHNPDGTSFGADRTFKTPAAPRLSKLTIKPHAFSSGSGVTVSYSDSQAGVTTFTVLRGGKKRGSFKHKGAAGENSFQFSGKLHGKPLAGGTYKLRAVAKNAFGSASHPVLKGFKVL